MPVKILLADKSITIQKVVEMLFSGKEYEVTCVSDGESALSEAARIVPDVVLIDVDLPRIDGYSFTRRLKDIPALAKTPAILMLSREDVYDATKGKASGIVDNIAKPFESQELIGKVKKAFSKTPSVTAAPTAPPAPAQRPAVTSPPKPAAVAPPMPPPPPKPAAAAEPQRQPKQTVPSDIFDIIQEAHPSAGAKETPMPPKTDKAVAGDEELFEVEPEYEVLPETPELTKSAPAMSSPVKEEAWPSMMAEPAGQAEPASAPSRSIAPTTKVPDAFDADQFFGKEAASTEETGATVFEPTAEMASSHAERSAGTASYEFGEPLAEETALPRGQKAVDEMREGLGLGERTTSPFTRHPDIVSFESLDVASRAPHEDYAYAPPPAAKMQPAAVPSAAPAPEAPSRAATRAPEGTEDMIMSVAKETVEKAAREILERVAWEVIPDLAERLIREEIERLKAEK